MIRKRPEKDVINPPGQITSKDYKPTHGGYPGGPDTLQHNIEQWKKLQEQRNKEKYPLPSEVERTLPPSRQN